MTYISNIVRYEGDPKILQTGPSSLAPTDQMGKALGWFSMVLGLTELIAPDAITRFLGVPGKEGLVRAYGAREIGAGMLCLSTEKKTGLWSRVAGDALDMVTLLPALRRDNPKRDNVVVALAMVAGITLLDIAAAQATVMRHSPRRGQHRSYRDRIGFPKGLQAAHGAAKGLRASTGVRHPTQPTQPTRFPQQAGRSSAA